VPVAIVAGRQARLLEHSCAENDVNDQNVRSPSANLPRSMGPTGRLKAVKRRQHPKQLPTCSITAYLQ
jgi:hypothetical protein